MLTILTKLQLEIAELQFYGFMLLKKGDSGIPLKT